MFYTYSMENNFSNEKVIAPVRKNRSPKNFLHSKKTHFSNKRFFMSVSMNRLPKKSNFSSKISYTCPKENNFLNGNYQEKQFYKQRFSYSYAKKLKRLILDVFWIRLCSAKVISTQRILILAPKNNFLNGKFFTRV